MRGSPPVPPPRLRPALAPTLAPALALAFLVLALSPAAAALPLLPLQAGDEDTVLVEVWDRWGGYDARVTAEVPFHLLVGVFCAPYGVGAGCLYYGSGPLFGGCAAYVQPGVLVGCGDIHVGVVAVSHDGDQTCLRYRLNRPFVEDRVCLG